MHRAIARSAWTAWTVAGVGLLVAGSASAQRVEGDRAARAGPVRGRSDGQQPGRCRAQRRLRARAGAGAGQAVRRPRRRRRPGVAQELRHAKDYVDGYDYRQDEGVSRHRRADLQHHAGRALRPRRRSTTWPRRWACRSGRSRARSRCCGWRSTTAAARAWSGWRRPTPRVPCWTARSAARLPARPADRQRRRTGGGRRDLARRYRRHRARFVALQPADAADRQALPQQRRLDRGLDLRRQRQGAVDAGPTSNADARRAMAAGADGAADALLQALRQARRPPRPAGQLPR